MNEIRTMTTEPPLIRNISDTALWVAMRSSRNPYRFSGTRISARSHARWAISDGTMLRVRLRNADQ